MMKSFSIHFKDCHRDLGQLFFNKLVELGYNKITYFDKATKSEKHNYIVNYFGGHSKNTIGFNQHSGGRDKRFAIPRDWDYALEFAKEQLNQTEFKNGEWVKLNNCIVKVEKWIGNNQNCGVIGTGVNANDNWKEHVKFGTHNARKASVEEVKEVLINEAVKREYPDSVWESNNPNAKGFKPKKSSDDYKTVLFEYFPNEDKLWCKGHTCYYDGDWAEIIEEPTPTHIAGYEVTKKGGRVKIGCAPIFNKNFQNELRYYLLHYDIKIQLEGKDITEPLKQVLNESN